jgi:hypothetical protein
MGICTTREVSPKNRLPPVLDARPSFMIPSEHTVFNKLYGIPPPRADGWELPQNRLRRQRVRRNLFVDTTLDTRDSRDSRDSLPHFIQ